MQKNSVTAHRPKREEAKAKELADLKRENFSLRRTVKRLEKEVRKRADIEEEKAEEGLQDSMEVEVKLETECPECKGGAVRRLTLAAKEFLICPECKWRTKV